MLNKNGRCKPSFFPPSFPPSLSRFVFKTGSEILI